MKRQPRFWPRTSLAALTVLIGAAILTGTLATSAIAAVFPDSSIPQNSRSGSDRYNGVKRAVLLCGPRRQRPVHDLGVERHRRRYSRQRAQNARVFCRKLGGKFDLYYDPVIVDAGITLNSDGTRHSDFWDQADNIAPGAAPGSTYNLSLGNYYTKVYDVTRTEPDPDQGWGGL